MNNRIGEEHPLCDIGQIFFLSVFIVVWILDSFLLHWSVFFLGQINLLIRSLLALSCIVTGIYFEKGSKEVLLNRSDSESRIIDFGVFSIVRHPTYLGVLLLLLGLFFWSFSLISLVIWVCFFFFYDRMASYEENDLIEKYNNEYKIYKKSVRKWIPSNRKRSACVYWSKKNGVWVLLTLSVSQMLVGGGWVIDLAIITCLLATRINKPLNYWRKNLPVNIRIVLVKLFPFSFYAYTLVSLSMLVLTIIGVNSYVLIKLLEPLAVVMFIPIILLIFGGITYDIQKQQII